jgi:hypothetical protein
MTVCSRGLEGRRSAVLYADPSTDIDQPVAFDIEELLAKDGHHPRSDPSRPTHAGAVVHDQTFGQVAIRLVTS